MEKTIYTHDEATRIIAMFEDILEKHNICVPSQEDDEREEENMVGLYGSTYSELLDEVEEKLIEIINDCKNGCEVIQYEYSGT